jgi:hypothetical protein
VTIIEMNQASEMDARLDPNLPWNRDFYYDRSNTIIRAGKNEVGTYIEIRNGWVLKFLAIKPVLEEGFDWSIVHKSSDSVIWYRRPSKTEGVEPF